MMMNARARAVLCSAVVVLLSTGPLAAGDGPAGSWWTFAPTADQAMLALVRSQLGAGVEIGGASVVRVYPPLLRVQAVAVVLSPKPGGARLLVPAGQLAIAPGFNGAATKFTLTAPSATLTAPRAFTVRDLSARLTRAPAGLAVEAFAAEVHGGKVAGAVRPVPGGAPRVTLELDAISIAAVTGRAGQERLFASFAGDLPDRLEELSASGKARLTGLSTDLTHDPTLREMDAGLRRGQQGSQLLGALVHDDLLRGVVAGLTGAGQAGQYRSVIAGLRRRHDLGAASGPLSIEKGVATIAPFSGPHVGGKLVLNLVTSGLSGYLSRVGLGRVTLLSVAISGTATDPGYRVNQNRVLVDGRRPSAGGAPSIPRDLPRGLLDRAIRGRSRGGLLGGLFQGF